MKILMVVISLMLVAAFGVEEAPAAIGKCTVVQVDGTKLVIECNKETRGFSTGNQIKIKSDTKKNRSD